LIYELKEWSKIHHLDDGNAQKQVSGIRYYMEVESLGGGMRMESQDKRREGGKGGEKLDLNM